jgi:hypothetical protein
VTKNSKVGGDGKSQVTGSKRESDRDSSIFNVDEDDEWTAILKFNALLHYEEQKQAALRESQRKRLLRQELDLQMRQKEAKKRAMQEEDRLYHQAQQAHLRLLEEQEQAKEQQKREKIRSEKDLRDNQLRDTESRRKKEAREALDQDMAMLRRLEAEMEQERNV